MERIFLGWRQAPLPLLAEYLLQPSAGGRSAADLSDLLIVLPGRRAQRRLLELLALECQAHGQALIPPDIVTVGRLPERLYEPQRPFASDATQTLAWARALEHTDATTLEQAALSRSSDPPRQRELAELFRGQHRQLAADSLDFAAVADHYDQHGAAQEARRWRALQRVQRAYLDLLDQLHLWDIQTARLVAVKQQECRTDRRIVLAGAVDMNRTLRSMLDQVSARVSVVVFAPPEFADRFDRYGCVRPEAWAEALLNLPMERTRVAANPADQAREVARVIQAQQGRYRADQIVVGAADERIVPQVQRQLAECGLHSRWGPGEPLMRTAPHQLLAAASRYLHDPNYAGLAELARHPDVDALLARQGVARGWLQHWDRYFNQHLPWSLGAAWLGPDDASQVLRQSCAALQSWLEPLQGAARPLTRWREPILDVLMRPYGELLIDPASSEARGMLASLESIESALAAAEEIPPALIPTVAAAEAIDWLLQQTAMETVAPPADPAAIELLGWLELPLDDAPALIVASFNEGFVPQAANGDLFLPNTLRSKLGIEDNARRYARDAYAISMLLHSRQELTLIVARIDSEQTPLAPSRLLLAVSQDELPYRIQHFFGEATHHAARRGGRSSSTASAGLAVPLPRPRLRPLNQLSVTRFKDYLACPYRFYLRHVLKLEAVDDQAEEMSAAVFGSLLHEVLRRFGEGPEKDSAEAVRIRDFLQAALDHCFQEQFGAEHLPAVRIQREQMRRRLDSFAERQAQWVQQGWRIHAVEADVTGPRALPWLVDGEEFLLGGKIDRLDRREDGAWAVLDYKSFDISKTPDSTHRRQGQWVDLQLPLYRLLAHSLGAQGDVSLGYVVLPKDTGTGGFLTADWTPAEVSEAEETARDVIRQLRRQVFWPPSYPPPAFSDDLASVCQDRVWNRLLPSAAYEEMLR